MIFVLLRPLSRVSVVTLVPYRFAMPDSVSPRRTTWRRMPPLVLRDG